MADFVKKKIAEKLARFTKDLKSSDISLNFLRGKGELRNLELNSELITDALRLPPWISVDRVFCDSVRVSVPFTDLHKSPIRCILGQVEIDIKTCGDEETYRKKTEQINRKKKDSSSYGLTEKIIDGMEIEIRGIIVKFTNPIFIAQLELTEVHIESTTPTWQRAALPHCRIKCEDEGAIVIFKRATWSSLKLEGWSVDVRNDPSRLRLITSMTDIRITVKRRISDCRVLATRVSVHLGDLFWVLTQSQLKAASKLAQSLVEAAVRSAQYEREKLHDSKESLASVDSAVINSDEDPSATVKQKSKHSSVSHKDNKELTRERYLKQKVLEYQIGKTNLPAYEVIQDSFHLRTGNVDLQLCDDKSSLLLHLKRLLVDIYLNQDAMSGRRHWNKANQPLMDNVEWSSKLIKEASRVQHMDLPSISIFKLREKGIVIRLADFQVRSVHTKADKEELLPIIASDKDTFKIPDNIDNPSFQCGITLYNYPVELGHKFLVPRPNIFVLLSPIHINFHQESCLWLVEFVHGVAQTVNLNLLLAAHTEGKVFMEQLKAKRTMKQLPGFDVRLYVPYSKITLPVTQKYTDGRPRALQVETGGVLLNNHTLVSLFDSSEFLDAWRKVSTGWLPNTTSQFPHSATDPSPIPDNLRQLIDTEIKQRSRKSSATNSTSSTQQTCIKESPNLPPPKKSVEEANRKASLHQLKLAALECWEVSTRCVTISFVEDLSHQATLYTDEFIPDFPLQLWFFQPKKMAVLMEPSSTPSALLSALHLLIHIPVPLQFRLKHIQFLFLLRLKDSFQGFKKSLMTFLSIDSLIESQRKEAFQTKQEGDSEEEVAGEETGIKEKLTAAILKRNQNTPGGNGEGSSTFTSSLMLDGAKAFIVLPSTFPEPDDTSSDEASSQEPSSPVKAMKTMPKPLQSESKETSPPPLVVVSSPSPITSTTVTASMQSFPSVASLPQLRAALHTSLPITGRSQSSSSLPGTHEAMPSVGGCALNGSEELLVTGQAPSYMSTPSESPLPPQSDSSSICAELSTASDSPTHLEDGIESTEQLSPVEKDSTSLVASTGLIHMNGTAGALLPACSTVSTGNHGVLPHLGRGTDHTGKSHDDPSPPLPRISDPSQIPLPPPSTTVASLHPLPPASDPLQAPPLPPATATSPHPSPSASDSFPALPPPPTTATSFRPTPPCVKSSPPFPKSPQQSHPQYTLHIVTGPVRLLLQMGKTGIASKVTVDTLALHELTQEEVKQKWSQSCTPRAGPETSEHSLPVLMLRMEMGKMAHGHFPGAKYKPESVTFLKLCGLRTSLVLKNIMACRNFFNDEVISQRPMALQLRVMETQFVLRNSLSHSLTHPRSFTVNIPDIFVNRGPRAEGTNLILPDTSVISPPVSPHSVSELTLSSDHPGAVKIQSDEPNVTENVANGTIVDSGVLGSYKNFMSNVSGLKTPDQQKVTSLLQELQEVLSSTVNPLPSFTEAISCDFYSNLTSASPHPTIGNLQAEVERLRRENQKLLDDLRSVREESKEQEKECTTITDQLVDAKVKLASAHLVLEQQKNKMEQLFNENFNLKDALQKRSSSTS